MVIKLTDQVLNRLIMETLESVINEAGVEQPMGMAQASSTNRQTGMPINRRLYADKPKTPVKREYEDTAKQFLELIYQRKNLPPQYKKQIDMFFKGQLGGVGAFEKKPLYDLTLTAADFADDKKSKKKSWFSNLKSKVSSLLKTEHNGNIPQDVLEKLIFEVIEEAEGVTGWTGGSDDTRTRTPSQQSYFQAYKMQQDPTKLKTSADLLKLFLNDPNFPKDIKAEIKDFLPWYNKRRLDIYHVKLKDTSDEPTVKDVSNEPTVKMTQDEPKVTGATISPTVKQGFKTPVAPTTKIGEIPSDLPEPEKIAARVPTSKGMGMGSFSPSKKSTTKVPGRYSPEEIEKRRSVALARENKMIETLIAEVLEEISDKERRGLEAHYGPDMRGAKASKKQLDKIDAAIETKKRRLKELKERLKELKNVKGLRGHYGEDMSGKKQNDKKIAELEKDIKTLEKDIETLETELGTKKKSSTGTK